ncbi:MAG: acyl-CoA dehydratase activase [Candidatus Nezhaarchaeota archaeon]|nr:acyl-CoA dehydratase activase [Candidatus Nezhaarchaeota archaeon]
MGIDVGSAYTKAVLLAARADRIDLIAYNVIPTKPDMRKGVLEVFEKTLEKGGVSKEEVKAIVGTGYGGRIVQLELGGKVVSEITCNARGARYLYPKCRGVIDVGGQDSKAIKLDDEGRVVNFEMNDKCAAGTGRFLELMSMVLDVSIDKLGEIYLKTEKRASITNTCAVFAQTEVISLISQGTPREEIIAGLIDAFASRVAGLAKIVGLTRDVVVSGGVARNIGFVRALESKLGYEVWVPKEPIIVSALGAALISLKY